MKYLHKHPIARLWYDEWNFCGCGDPDEGVEYIRDILQAIEERSTTEWKVDKVQAAIAATEPTRSFILYWLYAQDLTEHGSSIHGSWLTDKGKKVLSIFRDHKDSWDHDPEVVEIPDSRTVQLDEFLDAP